MPDYFLTEKEAKMTTSQQVARTSPDFLRNATIYQLFLRPFMVEGTLRAAQKMLPHLARIGIDIIYLCPICLQDDDMRPEFWSKRQKESGLNNPQNPYRIKDFFAIDPEYGTEEDLHAFLAESHALGMRVILDLVYFHCGPTAVFIEEHPDFLKRDANGKVMGEWNFPMLNFDSAGLREYLWSNMEYFLRKFQVDGYRCDVAGGIPLDFWEEGRRRMEAVNPEAILISEADRIEDQLAAFDLNYGFAWEYGVIHLFNREKPAADLRDRWTTMRAERPVGTRFLRTLDNHDIAHDCGAKRHETAWGRRGVEAALVINFTMDGVPFLYNGQEIGDATQHSIYGNREHGPRLMIDWSLALSEEGQERMNLIRSLTTLRRTLPALTGMDVRWIENDRPAEVLSYLREAEGQTLLVVINTSQQPLSVSLELPGNTTFLKTHLQYGSEMRQINGTTTAALLPYGYLLRELWPVC